MIARLTGTIVEVVYEHTVVLHTRGGVGYQVTVPAHVVSRAREHVDAGELSGEGRQVTLRVYHHKTERSERLFGFVDVLEERAFHLLQDVHKVGGSIAIACLGVDGGAPALLRLIAAGDVSGLTKIKGLGKKTAERIVGDCRVAAATLVETLRGDDGPPFDAPSTGVVADARAALVGMGFRDADVDRVLARVGDYTTVEDLVVAALPRLSGG